MKQFWKRTTAATSMAHLFKNAVMVGEVTIKAVIAVRYATQHEGYLCSQLLA